MYFEKSDFIIVITFYNTLILVFIICSGQHINMELYKYKAHPDPSCREIKREKSAERFYGNLENRKQRDFVILFTKGTKMVDRKKRDKKLKHVQNELTQSFE